MYVNGGFIGIVKFPSAAVSHHTGMVGAGAGNEDTSNTPGRDREGLGLEWVGLDCSELGIRGAALRYRFSAPALC